TGAMDFFWYAARLDAGFLLDVDRVRLSIGPMARAGELSAAAVRLPSASARTVFWGDLGAYARVDCFLAHSMALSAVLDVARPLNGKTFDVRGLPEPVHETGAAIAVVSVGVTVVHSP
ncbi:MAG: hypothetical protein K0S65_3881, partial [Labilithrix sp.]|nr:hypothetical protein [Labilithrix sp.]